MISISIKEQTAKMLSEEFSISPEVTERLFAEGIINKYTSRNFLIKREYKLKARPKEKQRTRQNIAERYNITVSLVEKIVLNP